MAKEIETAPASPGDRTQMSASAKSRHQKLGQIRVLQQPQPEAANGGVGHSLRQPRSLQSLKNLLLLVEVFVGMNGEPQLEKSPSRDIP